MSTPDPMPRSRYPQRPDARPGPCLPRAPRAARWVAVLASVLVSLLLTGAVLLRMISEANGPLWSALPSCAVLV